MANDITVRAPAAAPAPAIPAQDVFRNLANCPDPEQNPVGHSWFCCLAAIENEYLRMAGDGMLIRYLASKLMANSIRGGAGAGQLRSSLTRNLRQLTGQMMAHYDAPVERANWTNFASAAHFIVARDAIDKIAMKEEERRDSKFLGKSGDARFT